MLLTASLSILLVGHVCGSILPEKVPYNGERRPVGDGPRAVHYTRDLKQKVQETAAKTTMPMTEKNNSTIQDPAATTAMPITEKLNARRKLPSIQTLDVKLNRCGRCGRNAKCHKKLRIRRCRCRKGFIGYPRWGCWRGKKCRKCGRKAYCHRRTGKCRCRRGYSKNSKGKCTRKWTMTKCGRCGRNAKCHNKGLRRCKCRKGFIGNPRWGCWRSKCGRCGRKAYCQWKTGKCRCFFGYTKNAKGKCSRTSKKCGKCGRNAYCNWMTGKCKCRYGFGGNAKVRCRRYLSWFTVTKAVVCEREMRTIQCGRGRVLKVYRAKYGRDNNRTCRSKNIKTTKCSAKGVTAIVKKQCNGKRKCTLKSNNSLFGDPCVGTHKFLRVYFRCKRIRRRCPRNSYLKRGRCYCVRGFTRHGRKCMKRELNRGKMLNKLTTPKERDTEEVVDGHSIEVKEREADDSVTADEKDRNINIDRRGMFEGDSNEESIRKDRDMDEISSFVVDKRGTGNDLAGDDNRDVRSLVNEQENIQDNAEIERYRRGRGYCGKFAKRRRGRCICNRGFRRRHGKCVRCRKGRCHRRKFRGRG